METKCHIRSYILCFVAEASYSPEKTQEKSVIQHLPGAMADITIYSLVSFWATLAQNPSQECLLGIFLQLVAIDMKDKFYLLMWLWVVYMPVVVFINKLSVWMYHVLVKLWCPNNQILRLNDKKEIWHPRAIIFKLQKNILYLFSNLEVVLNHNCNIQTI